MSATNILVTGVGGYWGGKVAQSLTEHSDYHVMGLDTIAPKIPIPGLDFIQADIRNPLLVDLFKSEKVHTLCHLAFKESVRPTESAFDYNVMGTMKVLGACAESDVKNIIIKSSTAVYGASSKNPAFLPEETPLNGSRAYGSTRDLVEIEAFCNGFRGQFPQKNLTVLRFPNIIGPTVDSPMTKFLYDRLSPSLMGFDPMMQLIHEDDVVNSIVHSVERDISSAINIAAPDLLPLSKVIGLAGKMRIPVFHPFAYWGYSIVGGSGLRLSRHIPIELDYIRYRWVSDIEKMGKEFQFTPTFSAEDALREFATMRSKKSISLPTVSDEEEIDRLKLIIKQRSPKGDPNLGGPKVEKVDELDGDHDD